MTAPGYRVTCGLPGSGGLPDWGTIYPYQIRARDTAGLPAANSGSVRCPADTVTVYLPLVGKTVDVCCDVVTFKLVDPDGMADEFIRSDGA
jgi:hypothetical protein